MVTIETLGGWIAIRTPFSDKWCRRARSLAGKWDAKREAWVFPATLNEPVGLALAEIFGATPAQAGAPAFTYEITARQDLSELTAPVTWAGRIIAAARHRDSGAAVGDDVAIIAGSIRSGGSRTGWTTEISAGATFHVQSAPAGLDDREWKGWGVKLVGKTPAPIDSDPEALSRERQRLVARLAEIDEALNG